MMTDDQILEVVYAHKEGKKIQCRKPDGDWFEAFPFWDFTTYTYRIALEPRKPREWMAYVRENGTLLPFNMHCTPEESLRYQAIRVREVLE